MPDQEYLLEMNDVVKEFPGVRALDGVNLKVRPTDTDTEVLVPFVSVTKDNVAEYK